jgi:ABC-2 type transport system permease protein
MNAHRTLVTAGRVLAQLRADHRTIGLMLVVPCVLVGLLAWIFNDTPVFDGIGASLLGVFPFVVMFIVTSVATLRERTSGTLERLLTTPMGKGDLLFGYALAFGLVAVVQTSIASAVALGLLGLDLQASAGLVVLLAVLDAVLGMALGLFLSAFARSEFQAVQFLPAVVLPQLLLCGLFAARDTMAAPLRWLSDVLPLTYAVDGMQELARSSAVSGDLVRDLLVVAGASVLALGLGAATLQRRSA